MVGGRSGVGSRDGAVGGKKNKKVNVIFPPSYDITF